jgi:hypothetical protein
LKNTKGDCVRVEDCDAKTHHDIPIAIPAAQDFVVPKCPENEEFHSCGTACPATCENPNAPDQPCTKQCVIGCFCKAGMMRNSRGVCVSAENCEAKTNMLFAYPPEVSQCKENEIFMPCGSMCAPTCASPRPVPCPMVCKVGCFCKPGYLKNEHGVCVPSVECGVPAAEANPMPPQGICKENEEYRQCKGCDGTCAKPNPICPRICVPGCACIKGHLRDGNGRCMPATQCPHVQTLENIVIPPNMCGDNAEYRSCGTACPATCANPNAPDQPCTRQCVMGCFCKEGFFKNAMGKCVSMQMCDGPLPHILAAEPAQKCNTDREMYVNDPMGAALDCQATCGTPLPFMIHGEPQIPAKCRAMPRKAACVCKFPYVRNSQGQCVERSQCDN